MQFCKSVLRGLCLEKMGFRRAGGGEGRQKLLGAASRAAQAARHVGTGVVGKKARAPPLGGWAAHRTAVTRVGERVRKLVE